ncbi:MAG TPA: glutamine--tRNA ligase/YqeY domain fusion protein [Polyangiaceae bacterium]|nr:glutamine--tRNA ligase/YqeY domain fusion protein [Polyangiaceae bacterium]
MTTQPTPRGEQPGNFIEDVALDDLAKGKHGGRLMTRFPPEPNGYLHIGHAKSIVLNFGIAALAPQGKCNLRFDDTNPEVEDVEYVESIKADVRWLGYEWAEREYYASDYFEKLYEFAELLVNKGLAYVDSQNEEQIRLGRGSFHEPGTNSPFRDRGVAENLELLRRMRKGEFKDGEHVLRAKIDMASTDVKMRDPLMYRIRHARHHRTGDKWCIYPMYDFAHGLSDAIEGVTHSICTLEFVNHRPLYHWFIDAVCAAGGGDAVGEGRLLQTHPEQIEFAKLIITYMMFSKRKLRQLVEEKHVRGWDDPRMPTLAGLRRRGYTASALRKFCERVGVSTRDSVVDISLLEHTLREDLNATSPRVMGVLRPLEIEIENWPEGKVDWLDAPYDPERPEAGSRKVPFGKRLFIEQDDFMESPPKKYFRLAPGAEVRLRWATIVKCKEVVKDASGAIQKVVCTYDPDAVGGQPKDGRKIKGTIHWVSAEHAKDAEVRLYDRLFKDENPTHAEDFLEALNPNSLEALKGCKVEPSLEGKKPLERVQFERVGYFVVDPDSAPGALVFNRTITLKDTWSALVQKGKTGE